MKNLLLILLFVTTCFTQIPNAIPNSFLQDHLNLLSETDKEDIERELRSFKTKYDVEYGVAIIDSTNGVDISEYGLKMARIYGIGTKDNEKRGLLLLLAIKDRKWTFQISRHMEGFLTDSQSGTIGRNTLVPKLKIASQNSTSRNWKDAILSTLRETESVISKNITPEVKSAPPSEPSGNGIIYLLLFGFPLLIGGSIFWGIIYFHNKRKNLRIEEERKQEQKRREQAYKERREELEKEKQKREQEHIAWLKTPEGIAETKRQEKLAKELRERVARETLERKRKEEERKKWLQTPEGREYTRQENNRKREKEEQDRKRKQEEESRQRNSSSSYSSSSSYDSSSSYSSSSSPSSSGFSGGSDFGGGGSSGNW